MPDEIGKSLEKIQVDVRHLEGVGTFLDDLVRLLDKGKSCVRMADEAIRTLGNQSGVEGVSQGGGLAFGEYPIGGVPELLRKTNGVEFEVQRNLGNLATAFHDTASAIRGIAKDYDTVEKRNRLAASQVLNRLGQRR